MRKPEREFVEAALESAVRESLRFAHAAGDDTPDGRTWGALMGIAYALEEARAVDRCRPFGSWGPIRRRLRRWGWAR